MKKIIYVVFGSLCVLLGVLGIFLPLLPTTPFLLLAAFFYSKSSQRFLEWLLYNPIFGRYIKNYREGLGIPKSQKIIALVLLWGTIGFSIVCVLSALWLKILLFCIAIGVTTHLFLLKTY